ncbi:MAG: hypothetical protein HN352_15645 [Bacteroidetes bacterium]|jgi:hypothetical protein|nr:hypothetical protein [Bacteroidota bacterium]MBT3750267.1 hypothetical protein [Bacteroidota bacterium]MBT4400454.1 hypothetical protein [Bacteroidota bacterium]MBT4410344.1 hypothetical protein [Bacteroidota bacterium]MBT5427420.1 hypothetical protein [Bacteroidota bacterium]
MTHRTGKVIGKRNKYGVFGRKKYFVSVQFEQKFDRQGNDKYEYEVNADLFNDIVVGAFVRGEFEQVPEGLRPLYFY